MSLQEAKQFVAHFVTGDYNPEEYAIFLRWVREATAEELDVIADEHEALHESWPMTAAGPSPVWVAEMEGKLDKVVEQGEAVPVIEMEGSRSLRPRTWVAAASVIVLLSAGALWYARQHGVNEHERSIINSAGGSGLASLSQMIVNPRGGGQKQLVLADGSKVWLNAASTLKYPSAFSGPERVVELSGEGFFEVAKNSAMPFRVRIKDAEVEVLGTQFNIMAYEGDGVSRTTLVDGSVKLETGSERRILQPGEQAVMDYPSAGTGGKIRIVSIVDPNSVIAWKDGILQFNEADLKTVMNTVSRYYDVDIQFDQSMVKGPFTGSFPRGAKLEHVLKILGRFYELQYKIDGKNVTVTH